MQINQLAGLLAIGMAVGTLLFVWFSTSAGADFFLLLGSVCCVAGNMAVYMMLRDSHEAAAHVFIILAIIAFWGIAAQFRKFQSQGCCAIEDEDDEEEEELDELKHEVADDEPGDEVADHDPRREEGLRRRK